MDAIIQWPDGTARKLADVPQALQDAIIAAIKTGFFRGTTDIDGVSYPWMATVIPGRVIAETN